MPPWWARFPGRLEAEIAALERAGARVERDAAAFARGIAALDVDYPLDAERFALRVVFPDSYPYFRPHVIAPALKLARHQHPFERGLCLLGRRSDYWHTTELAADVLARQLPRVLEAGLPGADPVRAAAVEERQGEPISDFFPYLENSFVAVDSAWQLPAEVPRGTFDIRYALGDERTGFQFRGVVSTVYGPRGDVLARWDGPVPARFGAVMTGRWVRVREPIVEGDPSAFLARLAALDPATGSLRLTRHDKKTLVGLIGVIFPEEIRYRAEGDGWMFLRIAKLAQKSKPPLGAFVRAARAGRSDLGERVPAVTSVRDKIVALFGLGAVGAPMALDLARNQTGELRLVDHDFVEPGPTVRWPLGFVAYGQMKPRALKEFMAEHYPRTCVTWARMRVGNCRHPDAEGVSELSLIGEMLEGADLVADATAEVGVNHLLSDLARERGIPYVCVSATPGAWGGLVARIRPDGACWMCLRKALYEDRTIPLPPADDAGEVQPAGCADPTFIGAGVDLQEVALEGVRSILGTLSGGPDGYPDGAWDVAVLALRDADGRRIPPTWTVHNIPRQADCPCCAQTVPALAP